MSSEYDLTKLKGRVHGKYIKCYRSGTKLILLDGDVQAAFPDAESANEALRMLMKVAQCQVQNRSKLLW